VLVAVFSMAERSRGGTRRWHKVSSSGVPCFGVGGGRRRLVGRGEPKGRVGLRGGWADWVENQERNPFRNKYDF
jgi:hypothetical protein